MRSPPRSRRTARCCCSRPARCRPCSSGGCRDQATACPCSSSCAAVAAVTPTTRGRRTECDGLIVCIPVTGPWVQVLGGGTPTYYQLACPGRGQVIGGLDADRAGPLGITFLGTLGGPVGPGVTTGRAAVFVARTTAPLSGFRPLLGCIPGGGGGGRSRTVRQPTRQLHGRRAAGRRDDPPRQERPAEGRAERASRARLPRRRARAVVLDGRRVPHEPATLALHARLGAGDLAPSPAAASSSTCAPGSRGLRTCASRCRSTPSA